MAMPTRCVLAVRALGALLALLVGIQTLLPQLHCAISHLHPRTAAVVLPGLPVATASPASGAGDAMADGCSVCHFLLATGALVLPDPAPATAPIESPPAHELLVLPPVRAIAPPAIVWSSPRGPPTA